jgi:hypothetical protein
MLLVMPAAATHAAGTPSTPPFAQQATVACLKSHGAVVSRIRVTNRRLRALRDLAQKTSIQARVKGAVVGLAITRSAAEASFLYELLQVPRDPLRLERVRNVVLLSPKRPVAARLVVISCLRV